MTVVDYMLPLCLIDITAYMTCNLVEIALDILRAFMTLTDDHDSN